MTGNDLLARARQGDDSALGELLDGMRRYVRMLAQYQLNGRVQSKVDPSDLVQETFLEVQRDFANFQGATEAELHAWLSRILSRNVSDHVTRHFGTQKRNVARERPLPEPAPSSAGRPVGELMDRGDTPSVCAMSREATLELRHAIEKLPDHYQQVLMLRHFDELTFPQIAERTGRTVASVEKIWVRALTSLRDVMGPQ